MTRDEFIIHVYCMVAERIEGMTVRKAGFPPSAAGRGGVDAGGRGRISRHA